MLKMVPRRGDAPRSAGYRPAALLLSYGRGGRCAVKQVKETSRVVKTTALTLLTNLDPLDREAKAGGAPENRTLDADVQRSGFRNRVLVYAGRAPLK